MSTEIDAPRLSGDDAESEKGPHAECTLTREELKGQGIDLFSHCPNCKAFGHMCWVARHPLAAGVRRAKPSRRSSSTFKGASKDEFKAYMDEKDMGKGCCSCYNRETHPYTHANVKMFCWKEHECYSAEPCCVLCMTGPGRNNADCLDAVLLSPCCVGACCFWSAFACGWDTLTLGWESCQECRGEREVEEFKHEPTACHDKLNCRYVYVHSLEKDQRTRPMPVAGICDCLRVMCCTSAAVDSDTGALYAYSDYPCKYDRCPSYCVGDLDLAKRLDLPMPNTQEEEYFAALTAERVQLNQEFHGRVKRCCSDCKEKCRKCCCCCCEEPQQPPVQQIE